MNLGHLFLIYSLCKQAGVPLEDNEAWIHPIKAIEVKRDKLGVPRPDAMYDSANEPSDEDELREYQARFGLPVDPQGDAGQASSHPPPPSTSSHPPPPQPSQEEDPINPSTILEDSVFDLMARFKAYWDETQEHRVLISQDVKALRADMHTVLANQATILRNQQCLQDQLTQILTLLQPPPQ